MRTILTVCQLKMEKPPLTFEEFLRSQDLVSLTTCCFNNPCVQWSEHAEVGS